MSEAMTHYTPLLALAGLVGMLWIAGRRTVRRIKQWQFWRKYRAGRFLEIF